METGQTPAMDPEELRSELERDHRESFGWALCCCRRDARKAEVVLQAAYLKILQNKAAFDGRAAFKTWLFAVIRRTAADALRRELLDRLRWVPYEECHAPASREASPEEAAYRSEVQAMFLEALARLPDRQREVLQLVFYHDLSLVEAAAVMGVSVGSARTHYDRGKKQLRQRMKAVNPDPEIGPAAAGM